MNHQVLTTTRSRSGLSQTDAAALAGLSPSTLSQIESGARSLTLESAHRIAEAIGADPHAVDSRLYPGPPDRVLTLLMTSGMILVGETPEDDALVRQLLPAREGDKVTGSGPGPERSNVERLITAAAVSRVRLILRTDLDPIE